MSLWSEYLKEIRGPDAHNFLEFPECFVSWSFPQWDDRCIMIHDMYVVPALRKAGRGKALVSDIAEIGRKAGKKYIVAELEIATHNYADSFKAQLAAGFMPIAAENGRIFMRKEI